MKAKVLILHHNFPAQFRYLCLDLAQAGHDVVFLSERNFVGAFSGVRQITVEPIQQKKLSNLEGQLDCADAFRYAMEKLRDEGWIPDIVISHSGWGCGLDVSLVFPNAIRVSYLEWWFRNDADDYNFDLHSPWWNYSKELIFKLRRRNLTLALELTEAHHVVTPTLWQRSQLPVSLQKRCEVIHEGVDTDFFVMNPSWRPKTRLRLTYATRGMEPMRGFPEFVRALPQLLERFSNLEVVIAGDDRVAYGARKPKEGTFGNWARGHLRPWHERGSVRFVGHLPTKTYARLLKSSHVHCYLTRPLVASWSLLEAMASGCCLVASDIESVREIADPNGTSWVDHRQHKDLVSTLDRALSFSEAQRNASGRLQRERAIHSWNRRLSLDRWRGLLGI